MKWLLLGRTIVIFPGIKLSFKCMELIPLRDPHCNNIWMRNEEELNTTLATNATKKPNKLFFIQFAWNGRRRESANNV